MNTSEGFGSRVKWNSILFVAVALVRVFSRQPKIDHNQGRILTGVLQKQVFGLEIPMKYIMCVAVRDSREKLIEILSGFTLGNPFFTEEMIK